MAPPVTEPLPVVRRGGAGIGLIGSLAGFTVFILLMLVAVQVLFDLYARSAVTASAFDAARRVAGFNVASLADQQLAQAESDAEAHARRSLGEYGRGAKFTWTLTANDVELRAQVVNPTVIPSGFGRAMGIDTIDRTVRVHIERVARP